MQNLTELDVSENCIEQLDLSSLPTLKCINCSKNQLTDLKLNGSELITIAASNNSKLMTLINSLVLQNIKSNLEIGWVFFTHANCASAGESSCIFSECIMNWPG